MQTITVKVDTEGNSTVAVDGVAGPSCTELTAKLEKALGTTTEKALKKDYNRQPTLKHTNTATQ